MNKLFILAILAVLTFSAAASARWTAVYDIQTGKTAVVWVPDYVDNYSPCYQPYGYYSHPSYQFNFNSGHGHGGSYHGGGHGGGHHGGGHGGGHHGGKH